MNESLFKIGDLVIDVDPYKAPEQFRGHGIITEVIDPEYVIVYWPRDREYLPIKTIFIALVDKK